MKKRILSLVLALALCLGLVTPAIAADTSGLDATSAQAYYNVLTKEIQEKGIRDKLDGQGIAYAGLEDLNADGKPELIILSFVIDWCLDIDIWSIKNGSAVLVNGGSTVTGAYNGRVAFARKNGQTRLFYDYYWSYREFEGRDIALFDGNGNTESDDYINSGDGNRSSAEAVTYDKTWIVDSTPILKVNNSLNWDYSNSQTQAVKDMQSSLLTRAKTATPAPAPGTYGPYTITTSDGDVISFSSAKVEKKTVQVREYYDIDGDYSSYQNEATTFVTIRPDTKVTVSGGYSGEVSVSSGKSDGNGKYTQLVMGAVESLHTSTGRGIFDNVAEGQNYIRIEDYFIVVDGNTSMPSPAGFTDVKAGAYYADAVKWAVDKKITSGTSATTFSPDSTCTVAQILTFLWRANGSPEPTGHNPFSDISSSDYYYKAAIWAANKQLVSGSKFNGNTPCTRSMVVTYLWKLAGAPTTVPSGQYATQNITVNQYSGEYRLKFSAAVMEDTTIKKEVPAYADDGDYIVGWRDESEKVTLITMRPGSTVTVNPVSTDSMDGVPGNAYMISADGKYHDEAWDIPLSIYTGSVENAFQYSLEEILHDMGTLPTAIELNGKDGKPCMLRMAAVSSKFSDVSANASYAQAVAYAVEKGITSGTSATTFSPNQTCTRGQIVTFLYRAIGK